MTLRFSAEWTLFLRLRAKIEGDAGDALDLARRVDGRIDGALLAVFEGHHFLRQAEVRAASQFAQDEDVEAFDELALQRGGARASAGCRWRGHQLAKRSRSLRRRSSSPSGRMS